MPSGLWRSAPCWSRRPEAVSRSTLKHRRFADRTAQLTGLKSTHSGRNACWQAWTIFRSRSAIASASRSSRMSMKPRFVGYDGARSMMRRRDFMSLVGGAMSASFAPRPAAAQAYPARPVTLVVPFAPGGYTILLAYTGTLAINPSLYANPGYEPRKDFAPIGLIAGLPSVLVVHPSLPVRSVAELIAFAKAQPGRIDYAFVPGTVGHITTELFADAAGIRITRIPY